MLQSRLLRPLSTYPLRIATRPPPLHYLTQADSKVLTSAAAAVQALPPLVHAMHDLLGPEGILRLVAAWDLALQDPASQAALGRVLDAAMAPTATPSVTAAAGNGTAVPAVPGGAKAATWYSVAANAAGLLVCMHVCMAKQALTGARRAVGAAERAPELAVASASKTA